MRGTNVIKEAPWEELSEVEKARLTLLIAEEALNQLQSK
jgi:hypothetical protein